MTVASVGLPARMAIVCLASLIVMISSAHYCANRHGGCTSEAGWGVACAVISLVLTGTLLVLWKLGRLDKPVLPLGAHGELITALFLLLWWAAGTGVLTFKNPFKAAGNGFFGSWIALLASVSIGVSLIPQVDSTLSVLSQHGADIMYVLFASVVLTLQSVIDISNINDNSYDSVCAPNHDACEGRVVWAIILGCFCIVICALCICFKNRIPQNFAAPLTVLLAALWFGGWMPLTIWGPYTSVGNGYVAVCSGLFFSFKLAAMNFDLGSVVGEGEGGSGAGGQATNPLPPTVSHASAPPANTMHDASGFPAMGYPPQDPAPETADFPKALGQASTDVQPAA